VAEQLLMKTTILLLVSDPVVRSVLQETLERKDTRSGYRRPGQAVDRLTECTPDLLITRTYVEGLPGTKRLCICARSADNEGSYAGGLLDDERLQYRAALQGFEVFPKPYTAAELLQEVKDVLSKPQG